MIDEAIKEKSPTASTSSPEERQREVLVTIFIPQAMPTLYRDLSDLFEVYDRDQLQEYIEWIVGNAMAYLSMDVVLPGAVDGRSMDPAKQEYVNDMVARCAGGISAYLKTVTPPGKPLFYYVFRVDHDFCVIHGCIDIE